MVAKRKRETVYLTGKLHWVRVFGTPRTNYNEDGREWAFEFEPNEQSIDELDARGLRDRLKDGRKKDGTIRKGYEDRKLFLVLKRKEFDYEGAPNENIRVVDAANQPWNEKSMIGNGTDADVKVSIVDYGPGKFDGIYPVAIRVLELVAYVSEEFAPLDDGDPRKMAVQKAKDDFAKDFGLDDDDHEEEAPVKPSARKKAPIPDGELDDDMPVE